MEGMLEDKDWEWLLKSIIRKRVVPFIGAGACYGEIPLAKTIAQEWIDEYHYPLTSESSACDLAKVAQFVAVEYTPEEAKQAIIERLETFTPPDRPPDFEELDEPHAVFADLKLPLYITTNYDDLMEKALTNRERKPRSEISRWNRDLIKNVSYYDDSNFKATECEPVVFHMHGFKDNWKSLVLTEDDYLEYLINVSERKEQNSAPVIPLKIQEAIADSTLLFLGYSFNDLNFRVIFRSLKRYMAVSNRPKHISVQLPPSDGIQSIEQRAKIEHYLNDYYKADDICVYWGKCRPFVKELRQRWENYKKTEEGGI